MGETLDDAVYTLLRDMIIKHELVSGELIIQNQLAETLGVSRTPLRKAMGQLEAEGLLNRTSKGWLVQEFSAEDMVSIFKIRAVLEGLACRMLVEKLSQATISYMRTMFEEAYNIYVKTNDITPYYEADHEFHKMVVELTEDKHLIRTFHANSIVDISLVPGLFRSPSETYSEHTEIINALSNKDGELADTLMRQHIGKSIPIIRTGKIVMT
jgi:DNA-binding GntR family transcriptional regulator